MTELVSPELRTSIAASGPGLLLATGMILPTLFGSHGRRASSFATCIGLLALFAAGLSAALLTITQGWQDSWTIGGPVEVGLFLDPLSAVVLVLVSFLLVVVLQFSRRYMAGDGRQTEFVRWLCLTGGSVLMIVVSGNLLQFALAWSSTSWCLHQLLVFYPDRPGAILAARKKFIVSRLGDVCLLTVLVLTLGEFHSWNFSEIFRQSAQYYGTNGSLVPISISLTCLLLVTGAMLKSAQFPFHSWLPDTLEVPTPVSALMHAGIINAGGFLVLRLIPLISLSPLALSTLALFGAFTALFASMVMLTHASVKRALAFSTVAQMGFMMLECGIGAYPLALLHLVAHSLYKAHAFLSSGTAVRAVHADLPLAHSPVSWGLRLGAVAIAVGLTWVGTSLFDVSLHTPGLALLGAIFAFSQTLWLWNIGSRLSDFRRFGWGLAVACATTTTYFALHASATRMLPTLNVDASPSVARVESGLAILLLPLFLVVTLLQPNLAVGMRIRLFQQLYVHARNGFYFNTLANRLVAAVWPLPTKRLNTSESTTFQPWSMAAVGEINGGRGVVRTASGPMDSRSTDVNTNP